MEKAKNTLRELIPYVVILLVVIVIKTFIFTPVIVNGKSMMNTLHDNDIMILNKIGMKLENPKRFDIVVIQTDHSKIIKRVIALPGETIEYRDNKLYINGKELKDSYGSDITYDIDKITLGKDEYYVLGDNRTDSVDSRILGPINKQDVLGYAKFIIYPLNRFGSK